MPTFGDGRHQNEYEGGGDEKERCDNEGEFKTENRL